MPVPTEPKIYHIVHVDRLTSIIRNKHLWCDAEVVRRDSTGTSIGMDSIKQRRLKLTLTSHKNLHVGDCIPFYFCPRSVMLYVIHKANDPELAYRGGQQPIIHLEADLHETVRWADQNNKRWAFTLSNAGSSYFEDRCHPKDLKDIDWKSIQSRNWQDCKDYKQAEFLVEHSFPWKLVSCIGTHSEKAFHQARITLQNADHHPRVEIKPKKSKWYY